MSEKRNTAGSIARTISDNYVAAMIVIFIVFIVVPLGKVVIDLAMVLNLGLSLVVLLTVINLKRAADFTSFPRLVLLGAIFGAAINISSTRNIIAHPVTRATAHMAEQSEMVQAFANIVAGNNLAVGIVMFVIVTLLQILVITKGADRVSEVTARFTLDSMNNKMFVIQNQLNSRAITEEEADFKIKQLRQEIDFYSAMDGASKFVSGNVKFGIFVTFVNLIGGIATGMVNGAGIGDAFNAYARLTIGDGLMSQIPALLLSFATGMLITGSNDEDLLTDQFKKQFTASGNVYIIVGAVLCIFAVAFHNGASIVLLFIGISFLLAGFRITRVNKKVAEEKQMAEQQALNAPRKEGGAEEISPVVSLDELSLEIGYALIPLVDKEKGAELMARVKRIRNETAIDLGIVIPPIHIMDQMALQPEEYSFKIRGIEEGRGRLKMGHFMCLNTGGVPKDREISGEKTRDPAFGMEAIWVPESKRIEAEKAGYAIIDAPTIIATHLTELIRGNAAKILSRQNVSAMLEEIKKQNNVVVDEVLTGDARFSYGEIEAVLRNLLEERVSIRNMVAILETLGDFGKMIRSTWELTEKVRESLGAQICQQFVDENKVLRVIRVSQELSEKMMANIAMDSTRGPFVAFDPTDGRNFINAVTSTITQAKQAYVNVPPVIMCATAELRRAFKAATEREIPGIIVLSLNEIINAGKNIIVEEIGVINV